MLWRGSAAVLLMLAAGCGRAGIVPLPPVKALAAVGDASYALYLVHPFAIRGMREVMLQLGLHSPALCPARSRASMPSVSALTQQPV